MNRKEALELLLEHAGEHDPYTPQEEEEDEFCREYMKRWDEAYNMIVKMKNELNY